MTYGIFLIRFENTDSAVYIGMYCCETVEEAEAEEKRLNKDCEKLLKPAAKFKLWQQ